MPKSPQHAVAIGASAGGLDAIRTILGALPKDFSAPVFVVMHIPPESPGLLSSILDRVGPLPASTARHAERIRGGHIYVAPPDSHLVLDAGQIRLTRGPREHRFRPAIDPLFRSVAETYGHRGIGIVLSGNMADGTHGLMTIKRVGGTAIVQDPGEALVPAMPLNAIQRVKVDYVLPTRDIGKVVTELVRNGHGSRPQAGSPQDATDAAPSPEHPDGYALQTGALPGPPSPLTCPDCGGTLWELNEGGAVVRYRCHVGHSYSTESLAVAQGGKLEDILWSALRAMEEAIELRKRIVARAGSHPLTAWVRGLKQEVSDLEQRADRLRSLLLQPEPPASRRPRTRSRKHHAKKKAR